jgi:predicted RNase H-like HicB family nuclease
MPVHQDVLTAVRALCGRRGNWRFSLEEIIREVPSLNESTVRTHVTSRCCVNAPKHHAHRWPYFRRVARGVYELMPAYRQPKTVPNTFPSAVLRDTVHVTVSQSDHCYVAECLEIPVVTQAETLEALVLNLREAVELHLSGEDLSILGLEKKLRIVLTAELPLAIGA